MPPVKGIGGDRKNAKPQRPAVDPGPGYHIPQGARVDTDRSARSASALPRIEVFLGVAFNARQARAGGGILQPEGHLSQLIAHSLQIARRLLRGSCPESSGYLPWNDSWQC